MLLTIHERDIEPPLCRMCAACCRITFKLRDTDSRYRRFLRQIGYTMRPASEPGKKDCCDKKHDVSVDLGYCRHLDIKQNQGQEVFRCLIYETGDLPDLCRHFNFVSWAKANDTYNTGNMLLARAQQALDRLREMSLTP
jgi:Fe-S-cluster containining protein